MVLSIALLCYIYVLLLFFDDGNGNNDEAAMSDKEGDPAGMCSATFRHSQFTDGLPSTQRSKDL